MEVASGIEEVHLQATFDVNRKYCDVVLSPRALTWTPATSDHARTHHNKDHQCLQLSCVIGVKLKSSTPSLIQSRNVITLNRHMGHVFQVFGAVQQQSMTSFIVYFGKSSHQMKWKVQAVTFTSPNQELCQQWVDKIQQLVHQQETERPKRLHVIVNPCGGKGRGEAIYESKVAPLFELAGIDTTVTVTESAEHARTLLRTEDLSEIDGIISVGGDGTVADIVNLLLRRTQTEGGVDPDDPTSILIPPRVRVGIIPTGSTDVIAYDTTGCNDPLTSTIQIILGYTLGLDVCSVHHDNKLQRYTLSFLGYGFLGDVLKESENYRWMGPARYDFAGFKEYLRHQAYWGEVAFLPSKDEDHTPWDKNGCRIGCNVCSRRTSTQVEVYQRPESIDDLESSSKWKYIRGQFTAINAALVSGRCSRSVTGMSPAAHLGNGCIDLVLVRQCSRFNYLRHMVKLASSGNHFNFDFVEVHRVKAFKFRSLANEPELAVAADSTIANEETSLGSSPWRSRIYRAVRTNSVNSTSSWNLDGEIGEMSDIDVRVHCQLIRVFALGRQPQEIQEGTQACCICQVPKTDPFEVYSIDDNEVVIADE